jgi:Icc protein
MSLHHEPVVVVIPGDLHLTETGLENHRVALRMVDEVNDLTRPDFVQFIGDNVQDATEEQFRLFDELRSRLAVPHHALVGDHDVKDDPGAEGFRRHLGDTYGSTVIRGFRFIRLDTQQAKPLGLTARQVDWFRDEADAARWAGERAVVFQHNYPYQIWEAFDGPGVDDWRGIVQTRPIAAIVCGHTHYSQVANDGRNVVMATRSIGDPEGGPPGYTIAYFHGEDLAVTYRSVGDDGPVVLVTHPLGTLFATGSRHVVAGDDQVRVRVWPTSAAAEVRGRIDEGSWFTLEPRDAGTWAGPLPGRRLARGEHVLEVEVSDQEGKRGNKRINFPVDPTGRYTAVPGAWPRVTQTAFC